MIFSERKNHPVSLPPPAGKIRRLRNFAGTGNPHSPLGLPQATGRFRAACISLTASSAAFLQNWP
jgi:hypothetical protein